jgi:hypothetical protein
MTEREMVEMWEAIFVISKGLTYLLAMGCMVKYLLT